VRAWLGEDEGRVAGWAGQRRRRPGSRDRERRKCIE
jgi:hypothetical protein